MYTVLKRTCRAIVLLNRCFVLPRPRCRRRRRRRRRRAGVTADLDPHRFAKGP